MTTATYFPETPQLANVELMLTDGAWHADYAPDIAAWLAWALNPATISGVKWAKVNGQKVYIAA